MADNDTGEQWPRALSGVARHADLADPLTPQAPARTDLEQRLRQHARRQLPHLASADLRPIQFAEAYAKLAAIAMARAEFYGQLLASQYEAYGEQIELDGWNEDADYDPGKHNGSTRALIGPVLDLARDGTPVPVGEATRALVKLEAEERDRAAKLMRDGIRIGIEAKQVDVMRSYGRTVVASLRALCAELGVDWDEDTTRFAARRAIISARTSLGDLLAPEHQEAPGG